MEKAAAGPAGPARWVVPGSVSSAQHCGDAREEEMPQGPKCALRTGSGRAQRALGVPG